MVFNVPDNLRRELEDAMELKIFYGKEGDQAVEDVLTAIAAIAWDEGYEDGLLDERMDYDRSANPYKPV